MGEGVERVGEDRVVVRVMGGEEGDRDVGEGESGGVVVVWSAVVVWLVVAWSESDGVRGRCEWRQGGCGRL